MELECSANIPTNSSERLDAKIVWRDAVLGMGEGREVCRSVDVTSVATAEVLAVTDDGETVLREERRLISLY